MLHTVDQAKQYDARRSVHLSQILPGRRRGGGLKDPCYIFSWQIITLIIFIQNNTQLTRINLLWIRNTVICYLFSAKTGAKIGFPHAACQGRTPTLTRNKG